MDAGAFVQENKRWLIGCAIGGLVWLIASSIIDSVYSASMPTQKSLGAPSEAYEQPSLNAAREENELLVAERDRLREQLAFVPAVKYTTWSGPADQYLFLSGRELKERILQAASERDVQVEDNTITWEVPAGIDDIKRVLFGLDLIDEVQQRLYAAHDAARDHDDTARGLVTLLSLKLDAQRGQRGLPGGRRREGLSLEDLLQQQTVQLQFQADEPTLAAFLEALRRPQRTIVLDAWKVMKPQRPGEVSTVQATLSAIAFEKGK